MLAPAPIGPLGEHVADIWIDQPSAAKVLVEVRVGDRPVERRDIAVRGLAGDVAARLVAIAISEMVRAGMAPRPAPPPPAPAPRRPTPEERERASRKAPALVFVPEAIFAGLPASGILAGPGLAIGFRSFGAGESIFARWLAGTTRGTDLRWLEVGLAADYTFWLARSWRLRLGGTAAFSSAHLADAREIEGQVDQRETWSARAGGLVSLEARLAPSMWLGLSAEPGAILRPVRFTDFAGAAGTLQGAWLGAGVSVRFERVREP